MSYFFIFTGCTLSTTCCLLHSGVVLKQVPFTVFARPLLPRSCRPTAQRMAVEGKDVLEQDHDRHERCIGTQEIYRISAVSFAHDFAIHEDQSLHSKLAKTCKACLLRHMP